MSKPNMEEKKSNQIPYAKMEDYDLVLLAREDNQAAIETLLKRYKNTINSKAYKYYAPGLEHDDFLQEGNIGLMNAIRDYKPEYSSSFRSFCDLCVSRQMITAIKKATRQKNTPLNKSISIHQPAYPEDDSERTVADILEGDINSNPYVQVSSSEAIWEIIAKLKHNLSSIELKVLKCQLLKLSYQEISILIDKKVKSVDNTMQRIRKKLALIVTEMRTREESDY